MGREDAGAPTMDAGMISDASEPNIDMGTLPPDGALETQDQGPDSAHQDHDDATARADGSGMSQGDGSVDEEADPGSSSGGCSALPMNDGIPVGTILILGLLLGGRRYGRIAS